MMIKFENYLEECIAKDGGEMPTEEKMAGYIETYNQMIEKDDEDRFVGFSSSDMHAICYEPFGESCVVKYNKLSSEECELSPLFRQAKRLLLQIEACGELKLTAVGNLPPTLVKELYSLGVGEWMIDEGISKLSKESDSMSVQAARMVLEISSVIKKRNNKLSLTAAGKKLLKDDYSLFWKLFTTYFERFNWGYFDGYEFDDLGRFAFPFTFILLAKFGNERRAEQFYAEHFFAAFPRLEFQFERNTRQNPTLRSMISCYSNRAFSRSLKFWGVVSGESEAGVKSHLYKKTELFDKLVRIDLPK